MTPDMASFVDRLRRVHRDRLDGAAPVRIARAPGRLDAFGGVIDYTGGTVCEMPLGEATRVALQLRDDRTLRLRSAGSESHGLAPEVTLDLDQLVPAGGPREYDPVRDELRAEPATAWAGYVAGAWLVLAREGLVDGYAGGANVVVESDVPLGAGVSSSAALEMATLSALAAELRLAIEPKRLARLGQLVENRVVGAPCGLMDQLTVTLGEADSLLVIRCQPDEILASRHLPRGVCLGAIHTGVKHAVGGRHYTDARTAAFMGHTVILRHLRDRGSIGLDEDPFAGYLARIRRREYESFYRHILPERLAGVDFLDRYGDTVDTATRVDPSVEYRVAAAARHHILDNARTGEFLEALEGFERTREATFLEQAGEAMLAAHVGYRDDLDLGAPEADLVVDLAMSRGPAAGVYGGRITGGGCGGSVVLLGDERLPAMLPEIAEEYAKRSGETSLVLIGSSDGAVAAGTERLEL